ncbi:MAG TPA: potassium channel family protein [Pyrinomonadaceae bacterium]|nr:potassium channel family protein [Pyrinomonadaceae bacterium]
MKTIGLITGLLIIATVLWDTFETMILPRRVNRRLRLTNFFYAAVWIPCTWIAPRIPTNRWRETFLGFFGPLSLLGLLATWAIGLIFGFTLLLWATGSGLNVGHDEASFGTYLYLSGVTFFTLGFGDIAPTSTIGRLLTVLESANGFGLLAVCISYLPVLYQSFSRREGSISLLDARAGSPSSAVELLRRHRAEDSFDDLNRLLSEWEHWSASLLESHLSYPVLCYFRSQHDNQSWLRALTTVLDTCALVMVGVKDAPVWQARMTFAMARHALVDIAQVLRTKPYSVRAKRELSREEFLRITRTLEENRIFLPNDEKTEERLAEFREMYEPYVFALSHWLLMPVPPWILPPDSIDNWKTSAWGRIQ